MTRHWTMLQRLGFPTIGRNRRFVTAIGIDALGSGVWMPMSVLYFTVVTQIGLVRIGLALSLALVIALPVALVMGAAVDRFGAKRVLLVGNALQATGFALYPLAHSFWAVALVVLLPAFGRTAVFGSYSALVTALSGPGEREQWFGFLGALRNLGFAVGGLAGGLAIATRSVPTFHAVALVNAASYVLAFVLVLGVAAGDRRAPGVGRTRSGFRVVARDAGYRWLILANFGYALGSMTLTLVIPVYVVRTLALPGWLPGAVYVINTAMVGLGQGLVVRRMGGARRYRIVLLGAALMALSFLVLLGAAPLPVALGVAAVLLGGVLLTLGEMVGGPVLAAMAAGAPPEELRGRFLAVHQLSWNGSAAIAPLLFLWLLDVGPGVLWPALVGVVALGGLCCLPLRARLPLAAERVAAVGVAGKHRLVGGARRKPLLDRAHGR